MRRISTGVLGGPILGVLSTTENVVTTLTPDADLTLDPNGTGEVNCDTNFHVASGNNLKLGDNANTFSVNLKSPGTLAASYTLTMPADDGGASQFLQTDGSGVLSWASVGVGITDQTGSGTTHYPLISTSTSGSVSGVNVSSTKLSFVPSTGTLSCTAASVTNLTATGTASLGSSVDINGGNIDGTVIGSASAANGTFNTLTATTITETSSIAYKENVNPIENALESVLQLAGKIYDRKDGSAKNEAGLIAEEVANIIPNVVYYKDGKPEGIQYTKLTAYLIEAVKELAEQIKK
jgi:hypothetical protein